MAISLTLSPLNNTSELKTTAMYTATITGANAGSTTTYVWTVDGVVQPSTDSSMLYVPTTVGVKVIKVVCTTKEDGQEDIITSAETNNTIVLKTMTGIVTKASTTATTITIGESYTATATTTGAPAGATFTYSWSNGDSGTSTTKVTTTKSVINLTYTLVIKAEDYQDYTIVSNVLTFNVINKVMSLSAVVSSNTPTINQDQSYNASVAVTGLPTGANVTYSWTTGETTQSITKPQHLSGSVSLRCTVNVTATDYDNASTTSNTITITINKIKVPNCLASFTLSSNRVVQNATVTSNLSNSKPTGASVAVKWSDGQTVMAPEFKYADVGTYPVSVTATFSHPDYMDNVITTPVQNIVVYEFVPDYSDVRYIHPLPSRDSCFIWCGYWVIDEIEYAVENGINWKDPDPTDLKYKLDLRTIAKMVHDYDNISIQESRNGWILDKDIINKGKIYWW